MPFLHNGNPYGFGRVAYAHGLGIDDPASVVRVEYSDTLPWAVSIQPLSNWAGRYDGGVGVACVTYGGGETRDLAQVVWSPGEHRNEIQPPDPSGVQQHCIRVDWPAQGAWLNLNEKPTQYHPRASWMGSLLAHGQDASGQYYRRNRYYDAGTGRFTQEDPIGLAGGINLYGYANGDPVQYSDPYGLCPDEAEDGSVCLDFFISAPAAGGFKGDNRDFNPNAKPDESRVQVVASSEGKITWDHISGSCGPFGCAEAFPYLPSIGNDIWSETHGDGSFTVNVHALNSAFPLGLAPAIDASVTFRPNGRGGYSTSGSRDAMPSLGVYQRVNGKWQVLQERREKGGLRLLPFFPNDKW